jgi:tetratricopeptide (TPR) repeat protein
MFLNPVIDCATPTVCYKFQPVQTAQMPVASSDQSDQTDLKFELQYVLLQAQTSAQDFYDQGMEAHKAGQLEAAIAAYQQAIRLNPEFDAAYINLGLAYIQQNQFDQAQTMFEQALSLPDRPETPASIHTVAHYNLAIILERQGQTEAAIAEVERALTITPDFERAKLFLQRLQSGS